MDDKPNPGQRSISEGNPPASGSDPAHETHSGTVSRLTHRMYRDLFRNAPIGIFVVQEGKLKYVNPEFLEIGGYYEEELLGMAAEEIVHPDDWPLVKENAGKMLKGSLSHPYMYRAIDKDGDTLWIIESVTSVEYEGKRATLGFFMDVTEGEGAKEALRLSEEKFAKAFRSSPDWFVISTLADGSQTRRAGTPAPGKSAGRPGNSGCCLPRTQPAVAICLLPGRRNQESAARQRSGAGVEEAVGTVAGDHQQVGWNHKLQHHGLHPGQKDHRHPQGE
ncbi:MAG: PAS domain S-box protein [Deltaproteobacteria bacterium]|nr:PAS domain S-box protein [Deltaproteobacteria bacterium]MBW2009891.1 PAS domain S-box protein [Deltaproteobacteria bacterium]